MIHHISIPAQNPRLVAKVLGQLLQGKVYPFFPAEGSYIAVQFDDNGTAIEVYPLNTQILPADGHPQFVRTVFSPSNCAFHAAISVGLSQTEIERIALEQGWRVQLCNRGPFSVIELWLENRLLIELLTPELAQRYLEFTRPEKVAAFFSSVASA
ncbi:MAG: hypothetical protein N5P05_003041 [Chroococcopsis gigantea SAG 12.99]|jgi:hypothetical protein|nr:hypothetical protein [Chlorogloea purpurea SAG 13.99]MDV3001435.1 hypothetical protein [Chroococcopsis gigantea SAG 12.99]